MAKFQLSRNFKKKVESLVLEIAEYYYHLGDCGQSIGTQFHDQMMKSIRKVASAPLAYSSDWGHPQRRAFFDYRGQYTLICLILPFSAGENKTVQKVLFTNIYSSLSREANLATSKGKNFELEELF